MVRQGRFIVVVVYFLIGCAVLLAVACAGVRSEASKEQGHSEATKEQGRSPKAASEEDRCAGTRTFDHMGSFEGRVYRGTFTTNDVPGCPNGGLLSGTDKPDELAGENGGDEVHGLGGRDKILGGLGGDVIYGGPGDDFLYGDGGYDVIYKGDDALYGGDGEDELLGGKGEDVLHGGDGNDWLDGSDFWPAKQGDKLCCGEGIDHYAYADKLDYVSSSCEKKVRREPPIP